MATTRRSGNAGLLLVLGGLLALAALVSAATATLDMAPHAVERHGSEAMLARNAAVEWIEAHGMPPRCKDGRVRIVVGLDDGRWAITVLEEVVGQPGHYQEITSFVTHDQKYVKTVIDECGNGNWLGHAYGN